MEGERRPRAAVTAVQEAQRVVEAAAPGLLEARVPPRHVRLRAVDVEIDGHLEAQRAVAVLVRRGACRLRRVADPHRGSVRAQGAVARREDDREGPLPLPARQHRRGRPRRGAVQLPAHVVARQAQPAPDVRVARRRTQHPEGTGRDVRGECHRPAHAHVSRREARQRVAAGHPEVRGRRGPAVHLRLHVEVVAHLQRLLDLLQRVGLETVPRPHGTVVAHRPHLRVAGTRARVHHRRRGRRPRRLPRGDRRRGVHRAVAVGVPLQRRHPPTLPGVRVREVGVQREGLPHEPVRQTRARRAQPRHLEAGLPPLHRSVRAGRVQAARPEAGDVAVGVPTRIGAVVVLETHLGHPAARRAVAVRRRRRALPVRITDVSGPLHTRMALGSPRRTVPVEVPLHPHHLTPQRRPPVRVRVRRRERERRPRAAVPPRPTHPAVVARRAPTLHVRRRHLHGGVQADGHIRHDVVGVPELGAEEEGRSGACLVVAL